MLLLSVLPIHCRESAGWQNIHQRSYPSGREFRTLSDEKAIRQGLQKLPLENLRTADQHELPQRTSCLRNQLLFSLLGNVEDKDFLRSERNEVEGSKEGRCCNARTSIWKIKLGQLRKPMVAYVRTRAYVRTLLINDYISTISPNRLPYFMPTVMGILNDGHGGSSNCSLRSNNI